LNDIFVRNWKWAGGNCFQWHLALAAYVFGLVPFCILGDNFKLKKYLTIRWCRETLTELSLISCWNKRSIDYRWLNSGSASRLSQSIWICSAQTSPVFHKLIYGKYDFQGMRPQYQNIAMNWILHPTWGYRSSPSLQIFCDFLISK
jgi:hypothetical protein